jgi:hypothetical protein
VTALRRGRSWRARTPAEHEATGPRWLEDNAAEFTLQPALGVLGRYEGPADSRVEDVRRDEVLGAQGPVPFEVQVPLDGTLTYMHRAGLCATVATGEERYGQGTAFDWVGVLNRSSSERVAVTVRAPPFEREPFASITDLMTGRERPLPLTRRADGAFVAEARGCRARVLLRVYLPLRRE